ncbi:hypothetical protein [Micromonospora chersina]|uniref:hypothetical protein n=1 Tax=Micromonospora chersina TaxID=47854 RepID=UPI0033B0D348
MTRNASHKPEAETPETAAATAPAPATEPAAPAEATAEDGLVEVELTTHQREGGEDYLPGAKIRVSTERAAALRWSGRAKP